MASTSRASLVGRMIPRVLLAELVEGQVTPIRAADLLGHGRVLAIGVPGAFTPLCTEQHVPNLVLQADKLRASGFNQIVCIVANDPFVTAAWAAKLDPQRKVRFVSDGNLSLARELGLVTHEQKLFLGDRSERYLMSLSKGSIDVCRVEQRVTDFTCTMADDFVLESL